MKASFKESIYLAVISAAHQQIIDALDSKPVCGGKIQNLPRRYS